VTTIVVIIYFNYSIKIIPIEVTIVRKVLYD